MSLLGVPVSRFSADCFISYLISVTTLSLVNTAGRNQSSLHLCSMRWNVWLYCQSDSRHSCEPKILCRCQHADLPLTDSNRNFPHDSNATIAVTSKEPDVPRHSGTTSSRHTAAASRVPTVSGGSLGICLWKQFADCESVESRNSIWATGADVDRETAVSTFLV